MTCQTGCKNREKQVKAEMNSEEFWREPAIRPVGRSDREAVDWHKGDLEDGGRRLSASEQKKGPLWKQKAV